MNYQSKEFITDLQQHLKSMKVPEVRNFIVDSVSDEIKVYFKDKTFLTIEKFSELGSKDRILHSVTEAVTRHFMQDKGRRIKMSFKDKVKKVFTTRKIS